METEKEEVCCCPSLGEVCLQIQEELHTQRAQGEPWGLSRVLGEEAGLKIHSFNTEVKAQRKPSGHLQGHPLPDHPLTLEKEDSERVICSRSHALDEYLGISVH